MTYIVPEFAEDTGTIEFVTHTRQVITRVIDEFEELFEVMADITDDFRRPMSDSEFASVVRSVATRNRALGGSN